MQPAEAKEAPERYLVVAVEERQVRKAPESPTTTVAEPSPPTSGEIQLRRWRWLERLPLAITVIFGVVFLARTSFTVAGQRYFSLFDDSMMSMRYARNLAHGHGLAWNATGHPVEGYSNFLWTLWMAFLHLFPFPESKISLAVSVSGLALLVVNLLLVRSLVAQLAPSSPRARVIAMWLVAIYYPLAYWTLRGMEVGLLAVIGTAAALVAVRVSRSPRAGTGAVIGLGALLALGLLTRDDFIIPAIIVVAWLAWRVQPTDRFKVVAILAAFVVGTVGAHTAFRVAYYGDWLPNTYYLKLAHIGLRTRLHRGVFGLVAIGELELWAPVAVAAAYLVARRRRVPPGAWLLAGLFVGACAYSAYVGGDAWESTQLGNRYLASQATALLVVAALAIDYVASAPAAVRSRILAVVALVAIPVIVLRARDIIPASNMQLGRLPTEWWLTRVGTPLVVGAGLAALAWWALRRSYVKPLAMATAIVVLVGLAMSSRELRWWDQHNAFLPDRETAVAGLALGAVTRPNAVIALAVAGGAGYFSDRPAVDLSGKSDRTVAREQPAFPVFIPGQDKQDLRYSLGTLRPDLVFSWPATQADAQIERYGYDRVAPGAYVRHDSRLVDRSGLARITTFNG